MNDQRDIISLEDMANENGSRFCYAHEFSEYLGYKDFESFMKVIRKARTSSEQIGIDADSEFCIEGVNGKTTFKLIGRNKGRYNVA
jgi:hypothetical protein